MLISFTVENFLSFGDQQSLDLSPEPLKEHQDYLHIPYLFDSDLRLLKSMAMYGHNSHGKSNFLKGFSFFRNTIFTSFEFGKTDGHIDVDYFKLNTKHKNIPSFFEIVFIVREIKYRYGFKILHGKVIEESLWYAEPKTRENYLFLRVEGEIKLSKIWSKESDRIWQSTVFTKSHNLFLSVLFSQQDIPRIQPVSNWFKGNLVLTDQIGSSHLEKAVMILTQVEYRSTIQKFLEHADIGFKTILEKIDSYSNNKLKLEKNFLHLLFSHQLESFEIYTEHDVYNEKNEYEGKLYFELLKSESAGSIKYLVLACFLTFAIKNGHLIWIDELDSSMHILLLKSMIQIFNSKQINVNGSQMVFTLHNTAVLSNKIFRRDQIYFVNKNEYGESSLKRMHTNKGPVRRDAPLEKNYLDGEMGGISENIKNKGNLLF
jgi:AAA15 family ATPase/GTPase